MKKVFLAIVLIAVTIISAHAQSANGTQASASNVEHQAKKVKKRIDFSLGLDIGAPTGYVETYSSLAIGSSLTAEYLFIKELALTANIGYLDFIAKRGGKGVPFLPILAGLKYNLIPRIYISGQAGMSFYAGRDKNDGNGGGSGEKYPTVVAGLGIRTSKRFDIMLKYQDFHITSASRSYSFAGARIAYNFNLK